MEWPTNLSDAYVRTKYKRQNNEQKTKKTYEKEGISTRPAATAAAAAADAVSKKTVSDND